MKKTIIVTAVATIIVFMIACSKKNATPNSDVKPIRESVLANAMLGDDSPFIRVDSANKMLNSYLNSISSGTHENELHALIIDADALRSYLENTNIKHVKLMFAHRLDYINAGGLNHYAGLSNNALTVVVAGYDNDNNYVCSPAGTYLDNAMPCPYVCPSNGSAASDLLPQ
jgi:hypothetical protein